MARCAQLCFRVVILTGVSMFSVQVNGQVRGLGSLGGFVWTMMPHSSLEGQTLSGDNSTGRSETLLQDSMLK